MIPPAPGPDDSSRLFGYATPPDGAGPIGHDQAWPQKLTVSRLEMLNSLNPIHHIPIVGSLYRAATGQRVPMTVRVVGAGLVAGPIGAFSVVLEGFVDALIRMGPDRTRPAVPAGMSETGSEQGVQPVTPGDLDPRPISDAGHGTRGHRATPGTGVRQR